MAEPMLSVDEDGSQGSSFDQYFSESRVERARRVPFQSMRMGKDPGFDRSNRLLQLAMVTVEQMSNDLPTEFLRGFPPRLWGPFEELRGFSESDNSSEFDFATHTAVQKFQTQAGVGADGAMGMNSFFALDRLVRACGLILFAQKRARLGL